MGDAPAQGESRLFCAWSRHTTDADGRPGKPRPPRPIPALRARLRSSQLPRRAGRIRSGGEKPLSVGPEIDELHVDAEVRLAHQLDRVLQRVSILAADAHEIALDG